MEALVGLFVVYILGGVVWMRVYLSRHCGVSYGWFGTIPLTETGAIKALLVGIAWPLTVFMLWNPEPCEHREHLLERARAQSRFEAEEQQIQQALRNQRRH